MKKRKDLKVIDLKVNPDNNSFVSAVAMVKHPAIETNWLAFSEENKLAFRSDDERMEVLGPAMIPDTPIFRKGKDGEDDHYVVFSKETIRDIAKIFFKKGLQNKINLHHTTEDAGSFFYQSFITDSKLGINAPKGFDVPDGTLFYIASVEDSNVWDRVKSGEIRGFSVEGVFEYFSTETNEQTADELYSNLVDNINKLESKIGKNMFLKETLEKLGQSVKKLFDAEAPAIETDKVWSDTELKISERVVGGKVELIQADETLTPAPDGNYEMADGFKFTLKDGAIASIEGEQAPAEEAPVEAAEEDQPQEEAPKVDEPNKDVEELKTRVEGIEGALTELVSKVSELVEASAKKDGQFTEALNKLNQGFAAFLKVPVQPSRTNKKVEEMEAQDEKIKRLQNMFSK